MLVIDLGTQPQAPHHCPREFRLSRVQELVVSQNWSSICSPRLLLLTTVTSILRYQLFATTAKSVVHSCLEQTATLL